LASKDVHLEGQNPINVTVRTRAESSGIASDTLRLFEVGKKRTIDSHCNETHKDVLILLDHFREEEPHGNDLFCLLRHTICSAEVNM
jgi:hypothetical protein